MPKPITKESLIAKGGVDLVKREKGDSILMDSATGSLYQVTIVDPDERIVAFWSSEPLFRREKPKIGRYVESRSLRNGGVVVEDWIIKACRMVIQFADTVFISEPVMTAHVEGKNWTYDPF